MSTIIFLLLLCNKNRIVILVYFILLTFFYINNTLFFIFFFLCITSIFLDKTVKNNILFSIFFISTLLLIECSNIPLIWLLLEVQTLSLIVLIFINDKISFINMESLFKLLIISTISSIFILSSISITYLQNKYFSHFLFINSSYFFIYILVIAFFLKIGLAPLHIYLPEIFLGLNILNIILLSVIPKIVLFLILTHLIISKKIFIIFIISGLIVGALGGLNQSNIKLIIVYSSISHGSILIACLHLNMKSANFLFIFYLIIYFITMLGFFITILLLCKSNFYLINFNNTTYLKINVIFAVFILSLLGMPPFAGFITKWFVINFILKLNQDFLTILIIITTIISTFYYLRIFKIINDYNITNFYFWKKICNKRLVIKNPYILFFTLFITLFFILCPSYYIILTITFFLL